MSLFVRILVNSAFALFGSSAIYALYLGEKKAAVGAMIFAGLVSPMLLDVWFPGRYVFKKPTDGSSDTLLNRVRLFRQEHPGRDGSAILAVFFLLWGGLGLSALVGAANYIYTFFKG